MKSSTAAPSFRNSGLLTTSQGCAVRAARRWASWWLVPTGTVLLMTMVFDPVRAAAMASPTAQTLARSAPPSAPCGVPTAMKTIWAAARPPARSVVKRNRPSRTFRWTNSNRPGS